MNSNEDDLQSLTAYADLNALPRALGEPPVSAVLKSDPRDFRVHEIMQIERSGAGQHLWLLIEKTDTNSEWLRKRLSFPPRLGRGHVS